MPQNKQIKSMGLNLLAAEQVIDWLIDFFLNSGLIQRLIAS